jgi:hypothetical protein
MRNHLGNCVIAVVGTANAVESGSCVSFDRGQDGNKGILSGEWLGCCGGVAVHGISGCVRGWETEVTDGPAQASEAGGWRVLLVTDGETEESSGTCEPLAGFNFVWGWLVFFQSGVAFKSESRQ